MKKVMNLSKLACLAILLVSFSMNAQDFKDLDKSPMDAAAFPSSHRVSEKTVKVIYSRPQLKGRTVQSLAPNGEVWRTGANEATEITFYKDVTVGDKKVKAGTYSLFTIPGEKSWTIIINSDVDVWGAYSYNKGNDVARVEVPVSEGKKSLEAFSIAFDDEGSMHLAWGTLRVAVPMK
ncbi:MULTISPECIES: DUF2911 domain-containing protein [Flavobacteriaceae]|uniref:DUF2911 family protein n=1 Tax=Gaetbulibacter jejuensis TaxID=584607 RepID=A0ABN1JK94_9FLAO|nr:DUF2911 domain-containing protein [Meridianimaribacter sp. CL38]TBV27495.1 asparagine synthetase B [Meridianimaribacter sp. CL38]